MKRAFYLILAGICIGILAAPRKGSETRKKLKKEFQDWTEETLDQTGDRGSQRNNAFIDSYATDRVVFNDRELTVNEW